jgi:hypothetical protein
VKLSKLLKKTKVMSYYSVLDVDPTSDTGLTRRTLLIFLITSHDAIASSVRHDFKLNSVEGEKFWG